MMDLEKKIMLNNNKRGLAMKILLILLLFIFACEKTQRTENKTDLKGEFQLNSSEYKLLLNPEMFESYVLHIVFF